MTTTQSTPATNPKLGLALSGGGFRASLYHIGVLARLAELDLLKQIEVISTVSGGSIIGALYYLKIKELLENKRTDGMRPSRETYIHIIKEIKTEFLKAVQLNIRTRTFGNPIKNIKMLQPDYSRSDRIAELYTEYIYQPVWDNIKKNEGRKTGEEILLKDLKIYPANDLWTEKMKKEDTFDFYSYQREAEHKIPVLIINATSLNTGHCWQFTASWVGEKVRERNDFPKIDINKQLPPLYFDNENLSKKIHEEINSLTLGHAVAASACVPIIFQPLAIENLHPMDKEYTVQLVDGGVFDNQGIYTLIKDQQCSKVICSDASSQTEDETKPSTSIGAVFQRTNDILMDRVRDHEVFGLFQKGLKDTIFLHLRDKERKNIFPGLNKKEREQLMDAIASIRTDLDSFHDIEAHSLMYSGYKMCEDKMKLYWKMETKNDGGWDFLSIENFAREKTGKLAKLLKVSKEKAGKVFLLGWSLSLIGISMFFVIILSLGLWYAYKHSFIIINAVSSQMIVVSLLAFLAGFVVKKIFGRQIAKWFKAIRRLNRGIGPVLIRLLLPPIASVIISLLVWIHLWCYDWIYLRAGKNKQP